jgi:hypothetical protein
LIDCWTRCQNDHRKYGTPKDYTIELPDGVVLGEADREVVDAFTGAVHEKNWDNAKVNEALAWY